MSPSKQFYFIQTSYPSCIIIIEPKQWEPEYEKRLEKVSWQKWVWCGAATLPRIEEQ